MKVPDNNRMPDAQPIRVVVSLAPGASQPGWIPCVVGRKRNIDFETKTLERYCLSDWDPLVRDLILLAAAIEFCDRSFCRPQMTWGRSFHLRIPVETPSLFADRASSFLHQALELLTADSWLIDFVQRPAAEREDKQRTLKLEDGKSVIMPFSEGLDSLMAARLWADNFDSPLTLVRLGGKSERPGKRPFVTVPYRVRSDIHTQESSGRSRGFKFAILCGVAAYLKDASRIIVPESGQGSLAPVFVSVGQIPADYRNHLLFMERMALFFRSVFQKDIHFEFPYLWNTKGETLLRYLEQNGDEWQFTRSCWQGNRWVSLNGERRQCGACAACMLRRLSVHTAHTSEPSTNYIVETLMAPCLESGVAHGFDKITDAFRNYAIAGTLHLEHFASYYSSDPTPASYNLRVHELACALQLDAEVVHNSLNRLLQQHAKEWQQFLQSLGASSFVNQILSGAA